MADPVPLTPFALTAAQPLIQVVAPYIVSAGVAVLAALASWLTGKLSKYLNAAQQQVIQKAMGDATARGAALAYSALVTTGTDISNIPVNNAAIATGANYVLNSMTDTIKAAGITPEHVATMVTAELGKLLAADPGVTVSTPPALPAPAPQAAPRPAAPVPLASPATGAAGIPALPSTT